MIIGAHVIVHSSNSEADRAFFRDVLAFPFVDEGGWPIYGLPPSEVAVHPAETDGEHALYLLCEDVKAFVKVMKQKKVACGPLEDQGWGVLTTVTLPGGGKLGVYQPRHARPEAGAAKKTARSMPVPARVKAVRKATKPSVPVKKASVPAKKASAPAKKAAKKLAKRRG
jgi:hypothetical protein